MKYQYRVSFSSGKYGYGESCFEAIVDALGNKIANLVCDAMSPTNTFRGNHYMIYAKNGAIICEVRKDIY